MGVGAVKKIFGTIFILIGLALLLGGIMLASDKEPEAGPIIAILGLIIFKIGIVRVSTKSRSQVRR